MRAKKAWKSVFDGTHVAFIRFSGRSASTRGNRREATDNSELCKFGRIKLASCAQRRRNCGPSATRGLQFSALNPSGRIKNAGSGARRRRRATRHRAATRNFIISFLCAHVPCCLAPLHYYHSVPFHSSQPFSLVRAQCAVISSLQYNYRRKTTERP